MASISTTSADASATVSSPKEAKPTIYEHKGQLEAVIRDPKGFKRLMKRTVCGECGVKCMQSRFGNVSALVLPSMINMFWCEKCGRLLCEKHRGQHTCEKQDAMDAKRRAMTAEEVRQEVEEAQQLKLQQEAEAAAAKKASDAEKASQYFEIKERRHTLASKAKIIANFIQDMALRAPAGNVRQELLVMAPVSLRICIELSNEIESPTVSFALRDDIWEETKRMYERAVEISGMQSMVEGQPLSLHNSWEPAPAPPMPPGGGGGGFDHGEGGGM